MKTQYIIYEVRNKINDMIYIGAHVTNDPSDSYLGSGANIKKAVKEFGPQNFEKKILFSFDTQKEMLDKEKELVNKDFIKRSDTYNVSLGGCKNRLNTELPSITALSEQEFKVTKQQEQDFQIALDYAQANPGKFAHSFIGKGRWVAVTSNGETVTKILTTTMAQFPPVDMAVMNNQIVTKEFFESQKEKRIF